MKKVFISRQLDENSVFRKMLIAKGFSVHDESLLTFEAVPFTVPPPADWVFFYSKIAVRFFLENQNCPSLTNTKLAALGNGTADAIHAYGYPTHFVGDGDPITTAALFLELAKGCKVLFPRAMKSRKSIQTMLGDNIESIDLVVYDNGERTDFDLPNCQVLVFTSPLNATNYFSKEKWRGEAVVAIGNTTGAALHQLGIEKFHVSNMATEEAMAEVVLGLFDAETKGI